jgi:hypothetical protein
MLMSGHELRLEAGRPVRSMLCCDSTSQAPGMVKRCPGLSAAMVTQVTNLATAALMQRYFGSGLPARSPHPSIRAYPASEELPRLDGKFLDDRVCQQLGRELGHLAFRGRLGQFEFEALALPDAGHLTEAQTAAGAGDRITLRVMDFRLEHYVNDDLRHNGSVREAPPPARLRVPV